MSWPRSPCSPRLVALELGKAGDGDEILLVKLGDAGELLRDQLELALLCRLLRRQAADLLVGLRDPLAQLRALAGARAASRLEQLLLAGHRRRRRRLLAAARQLRRKHDDIGVFAFGQQSRLARHQLVELGAHHAEGGLGHGIVEPQHDLAGFDLGALLDQDLSDHAAGRMLHFLHARFDHDGAGRDHRAGQLGGRRPAADTADEQHGDRQSHEIELADRAARVLLGHVSSLQPWRR